MTLIIAGYIDTDPAQVDDLMPAAIEMMHATHTEEGCLEYSFTRDELTPGRVRIYEKWTTQEALDAHFEAPHMAVFQQTLGGLTITGRDILKYEIASEGPVR